MRIVHAAESYYPKKGGVAEVVRQLSEHLVSMGHEVTVVTSYDPNRNFSELNGVSVVEFEISGNYVDGFAGHTEHYIDYLKSQKYDILMTYAAQQWTTDLLLPIIDEINAKKVFVPCGYSGLYLSKFSKYYEKMPTWLKSFDKCVYLSREYQDYHFAQIHNLNNSIIIPNGASEEEFLKPIHGLIREKYSISNESLLVLHVGSHTLLKGHREALIIYNKAKLSTPSLFLLIGNPVSKVCFYSCKIRAFIYNSLYQLFNIQKHIVLANLSREETVAAYCDSDLFLFPSNIECSPIVLYEAMASSTPFLTTDVGNAAEIVRNSDSGILLPTKKDIFGLSHAKIYKSTNEFELLVHDRKKRGELAQNGRNKWLEEYTWHSIAKIYEKMYLDLAPVSK